MATVEKSIDVHVPVSTAYDQWTQFEKFPEFMEGVVAVKQVDDSHLHWVVEVSGEQQEWDAEIVRQVPDSLIEWRSTGGLKNKGRVAFEPTDTGAKVTVTMEYEPEGVKESAGAMLGIDGAQVEDDLERFKELVEDRAIPTGGWRGEIVSGDVVEGDPSTR